MEGGIHQSVNQLDDLLRIQPLDQISGLVAECPTSNWWVKIHCFVIPETLILRPKASLLYIQHKGVGLGGLNQPNGSCVCSSQLPQERGQRWSHNWWDFWVWRSEDPAADWVSYQLLGATAEPCRRLKPEPTETRFLWKRNVLQHLPPLQLKLKSFRKTKQIRSGEDNVKENWKTHVTAVNRGQLENCGEKYLERFSFRSDDSIDLTEPDRRMRKDWELTEFPTLIQLSGASSFSCRVTHR